MNPVTVLLNGDVIVCDRILPTNAGVLLFTETGRTVMLPMSKTDSDWVRAHRGELVRIHVAGAHVEL